MKGYRGYCDVWWPSPHTSSAEHSSYLRAFIFMFYAAVARTLPVPAPFPTSQWAFEAPKIASLSGWMAEDAVRLVQTGSSAKGYVRVHPCRHCG